MSTASGAADARRFFPLLIAATSVTFLLFPLSAHVVPEARSLEQLTLGVMFVGSVGHVAASFFFYVDPGMRGFMLDGRAARYLYVPVAVVLGTSLFFFLMPRAVAAWGITAYWVWQTHHYTRQNHGILAFASRAEGATTSWVERTAIMLTGVGAVLGMVTFVTPYIEAGLVRYGWYLHTVALGVYASGWLFYLASLAQQNPFARPQRSLMMLVLMLFYLPLFLFDDALSAVFTYAIAHGLQYLVFMAFVVAGGAMRTAAGVAILAALALGGGGLFRFMATRGDGLEGEWTAALFGAYLGIVMWHFLLDAGVWRLSEPFQRSYMRERFRFL